MGCERLSRLYGMNRKGIRTVLPLLFSILILSSLSNPVFGQLNALLRPLKDVRINNPELLRKRNASPQVSSQKEPASSSVQELATASNSRASEEEALRTIPWNSFDQRTRDALREIAQNRTLYRRLPMAGGYCNPEIYDYILTHPEIVVGLWKSLGYSQIGIEPIAPGRYHLSESTGTQANAVVLYHDNQMMVLYCSGIYQGGFTVKPITGDTLILLQYRFSEDTNQENQPIAITRLDCFIRIENAGVDIIGRTFSSLVGRIVDSNFVKTVDFVNSISESAEIHPSETVESILRAEEVDPQVLYEFSGIIKRSAQLAMLRSEGREVDYYLLPKMNQPEVQTARILNRPQKSSAGIAAIQSQKVPETVLKREKSSLSVSQLDKKGSPLTVYQVRASDQIEGANTVILLDHPEQSDIDPLRLYHETNPLGNTLEEVKEDKDDVSSNAIRFGHEESDIEILPAPGDLLALPVEEDFSDSSNNIDETADFWMMPER